MFNKISKAVIATSLVASAMGATNSELESRIEDLELSRDLNIFSFSGDLENRLDYYQTVDNKSSTSANNANKKRFASYFRMNIEAKPTDRLSFYGRFAVSKNWNDFTTRKGTSVVSDSGSGGRDRDGSKLFLTRAFINYNFTKSLTLSIGRLPTVDGPGYHEVEGTARAGAYPMLAYGNYLDGMALTHGMKLGNGRLSTRFVYTPTQFVDSTTGSTDFDSKDDDNGKISPTQDIFSFMVDYEGNATKWYNSMNLIAQYLVIDKFVIDSATVTNGTTTAVNGNVELTQKNLVLYAGLTGIAKTGLDFSLTYKTIDQETEGGLAATMGFYGSDTNKVKKDGKVILANIGYNLNSKWKFGAEYIKIDDYLLQTDNTRNIISFYGGEGSKGHHLYVVSKFDDNIKLIFGYMKKEIPRTYALQGAFGAETKQDLERVSGYARLIANF
ncbi:MAG: hypothetical protein BM556_02665 [Bacteriovorax sp. MedPE-SWde]|nr:MAG: hypothetical protein BM556_02665 [Bacteriovorax sp. MedPE-SWde]